MNFIPISTPLTQLTDETISNAGVQVFIKRLDMIHPVISGNKWFKLKYNLERAKKENKKSILTFGGAFSNHIAATAAAAKIHGIQSSGIIRGERAAVLNPVLDFASKQGMELVFISREEYRKKSNPDFLNNVKIKFSDPYIIPEGGANKEGVKGCTEILSEEEKNVDYLFCACGTATTLAGLILACDAKTRIKGIPVLKGVFSLQDDIKKYIACFNNPGEYNNWELLYDYHHGGYARSTHELDQFISGFTTQHNIFIEPVYTGKVFFAVYDLLKKRKLPDGSRILIIHTGGFRNA